MCGELGGEAGKQTVDSFLMVEGGAIENIKGYKSDLSCSSHHSNELYPYILCQG